MSRNTERLAAAVAEGDRLRSEGNLAAAREVYLAATDLETPAPASLCLALARTSLRLGNPEEAMSWAVGVVDAGEDFPSWVAAATLVEKALNGRLPQARRSARVALVGSFTTLQLRQILPLVALRYGLAVKMWEAPFNHYRQELMNPASELFRSEPDFIVVAVHEGELALPFLSPAPESAVAEEVERWTSLWESVDRSSAARLVQFNFALPAEAPLGHLGARLPGSRYAMIQMVNAALGTAAGTTVRILDCDRLSGTLGKEQWLDPRYWHTSKQAVSLKALPRLARHLAAIVAADLGLSRKCLVLDLDNTLWGGVVGEDGMAGLKVGGDAVGEAFVAFQEFLLQLKKKGVILAVCSKNNEADAREPFERHPEMKLRLEDFAAFVANWDPKPENLKRIAETLNLGLDALVFVDDNPVECAAVRRALPQVEVLALPTDPSFYTRALAECVFFETSNLTEEDTRRTDQYRARAQAAQLQKNAGSLEELWESLEMSATVAPFDLVNLPRIVQLIGKTNQFNLTTRRHSQAQVEAFMRDPDCVHSFLRLRDRFADHGIVAVLIAIRSGELLEIDTWLMSCRVIGRTVERSMMAWLCAEAAQRGVRLIRGVYLPTPKNDVVKDLYPQLGFTAVGEISGGQAWIYDLRKQAPVTNRFINIVSSRN